jgi:hypothetical protein
MKYYVGKKIKGGFEKTIDQVKMPFLELPER